MLEVIGEEGTREYSAAVSIADAISRLWPGVEKSAPDQEHIRVAANVKISGYRITDIDVVVCGVFRRMRAFIPRKVIYDFVGSRVMRKPVQVQNFVVAIEVKDHDESSVQIIGDKINVKYSRGAKTGWKSATDQNIDQVHSLNHYLKDLGLGAYIHRCVYMRGLGSLNNIGGALAAGFDGNDFFTAIASASKVRKTAKGFSLSSGTDAEITPILKAPVFCSIVPTALDRKRMDMIAVNTPESDALLSSMGRKMVRLRGHGGTGKTVMCLQMAWKAFDEKGLRTLVLTYNHALAADIRRLLALLHIPSNPEEGGIVVETVMSFMYSWFSRLQFLEEEDLSYDNYEGNCDAAVEMLTAGAISKEDIAEIISGNPDRYDYDCVIVDEAQDWPQGEIELLKALYSPENICLADGVDQIIRGGRAEWECGVQPELRETISLNRCLRMKRNLAVFINKVADLSGVKWQVTPNDKAGGGKVIILKKPYTTRPELHVDLLAAAKEKGNAELDFLHCVPPSGVIQHDGYKQSKIGNFLSQQGYEVWDGVDDLSRRDFPRSKKQFRVVQYASCRGLEGWTVVLHNADTYWDECKSIRKLTGLTIEEEKAFEDIDDIAAREAWRKLLIPLTRPIDTLVISIDDLESSFAHVLLDVAQEFPEFIDILE
ncbi:hypothetical protein [Amphritea sp. HPY]|uniref:hypothetical protein n=1 Tax=Amphritea sp. HPY TaxID=3421652 RepID=UPI003D7D6AAD